MDAATRANWEAGFGGILKRAEAVTMAKRDEATRRWWGDARRWWDDTPDDTRPTEVEAIKRVFDSCRNAAPVRKVVDQLVFSDYRRSWQSADWESFNDAVADGQAWPKQLKMPLFDVGIRTVS